VIDLKVYLVGDHGPEHSHVISVHKTKEGALKAFQARRMELLEEAKERLKQGDSDWAKEMFKETVKNLSEKNPDKIDNGAQETPFIRKMELKE
jgi:acyl-CoA reductase-like NAD-dependent aldehyde dehydrogenase